MEARMPYRTPAALELSEAERAELEGWARRRKTAQALALRARIVLRAAKGLSNTAIADELGVAKHRPVTPSLGAGLRHRRGAAPGTARLSSAPRLAETPH